MNTKRTMAAAMAAVLIFLICSICGCDAKTPFSVQTVTYTATSRIVER